MLAFQTALITDRGGRPYNEDACGHWQSEQRLCCVLADGAGGHGGGDIASRLAVQDLLGRFALAPSVDAASLAALLRQTNDALREQREPGTERQDMHSTVVCVVVDGLAQRAHWAHVGDSRLYWFRAGRLLQRTRDHSLVQTLVDAGLLAVENLRSHPQRSELRSALGLSDEEIEIGYGDAEADVLPGDVFLMCTDGLWEYLPDEALSTTLAAASHPQTWLDTLAGEVRRVTANKTSHDNFTALAVWIGSA